jgi:hypothetical protein
MDSYLIPGFAEEGRAGIHTHVTPLACHFPGQKTTLYKWTNMAVWKSQGQGRGQQPNFLWDEED